MLVEVVESGEMCACAMLWLLLMPIVPSQCVRSILLIFKSSLACLLSFHVQPSSSPAGNFVRKLFSLRLNSDNKLSLRPEPPAPCSQTSATRVSLCSALLHTKSLHHPVSPIPLASKWRPPWALLGHF